MTWTSGITLVAAVIAACASAWVAFTNRKTEHEKWLRDQRAKAYSEYIGAVHAQRLWVALRGADFFTVPMPQVSEEERERFRADIQASETAITNAYAMTRLVAGREVTAAAEALHRLVSSAQPSHIATKDFYKELTEKTDNLVLAARSELLAPRKKPRQQAR